MKGCLAVGVADGVVGRVVGGMDPNKGSIFFGDGAIDINVGWGPISYVKIFKVIQNAMFGGMGVAADHSFSLGELGGQLNDVGSDCFFRGCHFGIGPLNIEEKKWGQQQKWNEHPIQ